MIFNQHATDFLSQKNNGITLFHAETRQSQLPIFLAFRHPA